MVRLPPLNNRRSVRATAAHPPRVLDSISFSSQVLCSFWQAVGAPGVLYHGPLGEIIGEVPVDTVVREVLRYRDPFGGWWIASLATDRSLVWILISAEGATSGTAHWQRVYDERTPEEERHNSQLRDEQMQRHHGALAYLEMNTMDIPSMKDSVLRDIQLLESCWRDVSAALERGGCRDWNAEYQVLVESVLFDSWEKSVYASEELRVWMNEFTEAAEEVVMVVVADMLRPSSERVTKAIKNDTLGNFLYNNLLVKIAIDDAIGDIKGNVGAWKKASQAIQGLQLIALEGPKRFLYTPPTALVTFSGLRFYVVAVPPIDVENVVYLPLLQQDNGLDPPNFVKAQATDLGLSIGLEQYSLRLENDDVVHVTLPVDVAIVAGYDKRLYIMNTLRVLPALAIVSDGSTDPSLMSSGAVCLRFRPEFIVSWTGARMQTDLFLGDEATSENKHGILEATEFVRDNLIPKVAGMLGFQQAVDLPLQDVAECRLCSCMMENELRFVVCRSAEKCCCICSHCYTKGLLGAKKKERSLFADAVKCNSTPRNAKGLLLEPSLTSIFHANGLNMRFLPFVYHRMTYAARFSMANYCETEMIARTAVHILHEKLRRTTHTTDDVKGICEAFFLGLLQSSGAVAERFWTEELGPTLEKLYGPLEPFNTSEIDIELLYHSVARLSGVHLDDASIRSLSSEKPYLRLASVRPLVKIVRPPHVADAESHKETETVLLERMEDILLFWIGFSETHKCTDEGKLIQPFYMMK